MLQDCATGYHIVIVFILFETRITVTGFNKRQNDTLIRLHSMKMLATMNDITNPVSFRTWLHAHKYWVCKACTHWVRVMSTVAKVRCTSTKMANINKRFAEHEDIYFNASLYQNEILKISYRIDSFSIRYILLWYFIAVRYLYF